MALGDDKEKMQCVPFEKWFIEVVILSMAPTVFVLLFRWMMNQKISFLSVFGRGDLLLLAAIISISSILHLYWNRNYKPGTLKKIAFYLSLLCSLISLIIYSGVTIGKMPQTHIASSSIISILCSYLSSYAAER